jgi:hypothetical protein
MTYRYRTTKVDGRTKLLHRHIAEQLQGRPLARNEHVHHRNEDPWDNRPENLEVLTAQEHAAHHKQKHPREKPCAVCGAMFEPHPTKRARQITCSPACAIERSARTRAKLSPEQVASIRQRYAAGGVTQLALAAEFGVSHSRVNQLVRGVRPEVS